MNVTSSLEQHIIINAAQLTRELDFEVSLRNSPRIDEVNLEQQLGRGLNGKASDFSGILLFSK